MQDHSKIDNAQPIDDIEALQAELTKLSASFASDSESPITRDTLSADDHQETQEPLILAIDDVVDGSPENLHFDHEEEHSAGSFADELRTELTSHLMPTSEIDKPITPIDFRAIAGLQEVVIVEEPGDGKVLDPAEITTTELVKRPQEIASMVVSEPGVSAIPSSIENDLGLSINDSQESGTEAAEHAKEQAPQVGVIEYNYDRDRSVDKSKLLPTVDQGVQKKSKKKSAKRSHKDSSGGLIPTLDKNSSQHKKDGIIKPVFAVVGTILVAASVATNVFLAPYLTAHPQQVIEGTKEAWTSALHDGRVASANILHALCTGSAGGLLTSSGLCGSSTPARMPSVATVKQDNTSVRSSATPAVDAPSVSPAKQPPASPVQMPPKAAETKATDVPTLKAPPVDSEPAKAIQPSKALPEKDVSPATAKAPSTEVKPAPVDVKSSKSAAKSATTAAPLAVAATPPTCSEWSGLNETAASALKDSLKKEKVLFSSVETSTPLFYVVAVDAAQAPKGYMTELKAKGIPSFLIKEDGALKGNFSLGQFRSEVGALKHKHNLEAKGVQYLVTGAYKSIKSSTIRTLSGGEPPRGFAFPPSRKLACSN